MQLSLKLLGWLFLLLFIPLTTYASPYNFGDTITIYWNTFDTADGSSLAATGGAPTIQIFKVHNSGGRTEASIVGATAMTQDSAGAYYYDFIAPSANEIYQFEIIWTQQGIAHFFKGGYIHVWNGISALIATDMSGAQTENTFGDFLKIAGDSASWASLDDVWQNRDTLGVDSSILGEWLAKASWNAASRTLTDKTGFSLSSSQTFNLTGNITGNISGSIGSVTGSVGSIATGGITFGSFAGTTPTAWWNEGKTGYSLTQSFPTNFASFAITASGLVTSIDTLGNGESIAVQPGDWTGDDSTAYQGAAGASVWNATQRDSVLTALEDNRVGVKVWTLGLFSPRDYLDAAISTRSTFNVGIDSVIIDVSSSMFPGGLTDSIASQAADSTFAEFISGTNENNFKADVSALALESSVATLRDSVSLIGVLLAQQFDSVNVLVSSTYYTGQREGWIQIGFPIGSRYKRYFEIWDTVGVDTKIATVYRSVNVSDTTVTDTISFDVE